MFLNRDPPRHRKLHGQYKPEAQASEYHGLFTRLRFGLVFVASRSKSHVKLNAISWSARDPSLTRRVMKSFPHL